MRFTESRGRLPNSCSKIFLFACIGLMLTGCGTFSNPSGVSSATGSGPAVFVPPNVTTIQGDPAQLEQLMLERINRARLHPADEANRSGIAINEGLTDIVFDAHPRPPV